jgi:hypothetical protein
MAGCLRVSKSELLKQNLKSCSLPKLQHTCCRSEMSVMTKSEYGVSNAWFYMKRRLYIWFDHIIMTIAYDSMHLLLKFIF